MRSLTWRAVGVFCLAAVLSGGAERAPGLGGAEALRGPAARAQASAELLRRSRSGRAEAEALARRHVLPLRGSYPDGGGWELVGAADGKLVYYTTLNAAAGVSAGANLLWPAPHGLTGTGCTMGVWDQGAARLAHQELAGRVAVLDGAAPADHSTHVVGTVCAAGVSAAAKGMAPAARVDNYDWADDAAEMAARGAAYPREPGALGLSNHSYGQLVGWVYTGGTPAFTWYGSGTDASAVEEDFGRYDSLAEEVDALAHSLPYYLTFWAAGNDRGLVSPYNPVAGSSVALWPGAPATTYSPALHPPGDGAYRGGFDTICGRALAKNVVTVGSVVDAVTGGLRDLSKAANNSWSSWGPADDGRIKPDLVANGYVLTSCMGSSDSAYSTYNGTSQSSASAAGAALLAAECFGRLFTNHALRASTLKALLIHTADDLGRPGPDYQYGWGLLNVAAAADLLAAYRTNAGARQVVEDRVSTNRPSVSFPFSWDGASPLRATLCWTDPAGAATTNHDARASRLVNDLNLSVAGPAGSAHLPWVMPFVGDWTTAGTNALAACATTGTNATDNVEQVWVAAPPAAGVYTATVSFAGALDGGSQAFSLILSGAASSPRAPPPSLTASAPRVAPADGWLTLMGDGFMAGADVRLQKAGAADAPGAHVEPLGDVVRLRVDPAGLASGWWNVALTNPDGQRAVLTNAFGVPGAGRSTLLSVR